MATIGNELCSQAQCYQRAAVLAEWSEPSGWEGSGGGGGGGKGDGLPVLQRLCRGLCLALCASGDPALLDESCSMMTVAAGTGGPSLSGRFVTVARKASSGQGAGSAGLVYPALLLAASLRAGGEEDRRELTGLFLSALLSALSAAPSSAILPPRR